VRDPATGILGLVFAGIGQRRCSWCSRRLDAFQAAAAPFERHARCVTGGPPTGGSGATPVSRPIRSDAERHLPTSVRRSKVANTMPLIPSNRYSRGPLQRLTRVPGCGRKHSVLRGRGVLLVHKQRSTANGRNEALMTTGGLRNAWMETLRSFRCRCMYEAAMHPLVQRGAWGNHVLPEVPK
jgi:hypothetical protein